MAKYLVKKEFINHDAASIYHVGAEIVRGGDLYPDQRYFNALVNYGFIEEVKDKWWRSANIIGGVYWYLDERARATESVDCMDSDTERYELGNYFKSQETAEKVAEALRLFFEYLHDEYAEPLNNDSLPGLHSVLRDAIHKASDAVLEDDKTQ